MYLDINADLGEGVGTDADLMPLITSANICCGFHAGNAETARATLELAAQHGVTVGAHPGYEDRENFGRIEQNLTEKQVVTIMTHQVGAILGLARITRSVVKYLKPHGALYNQACREISYARAVVAVAFLNGLSVMGLPGSQLEIASNNVGLPFIPEGFADRRYLSDGSLVPRTEPNALITDTEEAVQQVGWLVREKKVRTICVHGDNPEAVRFLRVVRGQLEGAGYRFGRGE